MRWEPSLSFVFLVVTQFKSLPTYQVKILAMPRDIQFITQPLKKEMNLLTKYSSAFSVHQNHIQVKMLWKSLVMVASISQEKFCPSFLAQVHVWHVVENLQNVHSSVEKWTCRKQKVSMT